MMCGAKYGVGVKVGMDSVGVKVGPITHVAAGLGVPVGLRVNALFGMEVGSGDIVEGVIVLFIPLTAGVKDLEKPAKGPISC